MNELSIHVADGRTAFEPGETVEVLAEWRLDTRPDRLEVRLVWFTRGKGDRDWSQVETITFEGPQAYDSRRCSITLPLSSSAGTSNPPLLEDLYDKHQGNLRDAIRELYDRWAAGDFCD